MRNETREKVAFIVGKGKQDFCTILFEYIAKYGYIERKTLYKHLHDLTENGVIKRVKRGVYQ